MRYFISRSISNLLLKRVRLFVISLCLIHSNTPYAELSLDSIKESLSEEILKKIDFSENLISIINGKAEQPLKLSKDDVKALKLLGYSDEEISSLTKKDLFDDKVQDKFNDRLNKYANNKNDELNSALEEKLAPGLASSVIGLGFSSLLGIVIGTKCYNQPSALTFAGTSAAWAALEMMIWKGYQINMDDIQMVVDASEIPSKINNDVEEIKEILKKLEENIKNTNITTFDEMLDESKKDFLRLKEIATTLRDYLNRAKDSQFGAVRSIQESLELAAETSEKKSKNAKIAAIGFVAAGGVATAEAFKAFGDGGKCAVGSKASIDINILNSILSIFPSAHAGFANIGDLDKIGIPIGAGLGAAYSGFKQKFADKIFNSAPSRAAIFFAMAGLAYYASYKLKEASDFLNKQASEINVFASSIEDKLNSLSGGFDTVQELIQEVKSHLLPAFEKLKESVQNNKKLQESLKQISGVVDQIKDLDSNLESTINDEISQGKEELIEAIDKVKLDISNFDASEYVSKLTGYQIILDLIFPNTYASNDYLKIKPSCFKRGKNYPIMDENCLCKKNNQCLSTRFPKNLTVNRGGDYVKLVMKNAFKVSRANDLILSGNPYDGISTYRTISSNAIEIEKKSIHILNQKASKKINLESIIELSAKMKNSTKDGLKEYFSHNKINKAIAAKSNVNTDKIPSRIQMNESQQNIITSLKKHAYQAKKLGNPSLTQVKLDNSISTPSNYDYSTSTIIKDRSVNIFHLIKKRYMKVQADGRL
jgi:hypothetical protein